MLGEDDAVYIGWIKVANLSKKNDPVTAPLVRMIFEGYGAGDSTTAIAARLNATGVKTRLGREWGKAHVYLMTGKLFCARCGERMMGKGGTSKTGAKYHCYTCWGHINHRCETSSVNQDWLEDTIFEALSAVIDDDAVVARIADKIVELQASQYDPNWAIHLVVCVN